MQRSARPLCSLPPELHDKIWSLTFEPRTISIYLHEGRTPEGILHPTATLPPRANCHLKPACIAFTAALGVEPPRLLQHRFREMTESRNQNPFCSFTIPDIMRVKPPAGPVALRVCRQSRQFAMKHYKLAFASVNFVENDVAFETFWGDLNLGEKRIWVNYKLDLLFFHDADARSSIWGTRNDKNFDLEILATLAPDEVSKIRNLGVSGVWSDLTGPFRKWGDTQNVERPPPPLPNGILQSIFDSTIHKFESLQNLLVHNTDGHRLKVRELTGNRAIVLRDLAQIEKDIHAYLKTAKKVTVEVTALKGFEVRPAIWMYDQFELPDANQDDNRLAQAPSTSYYLPSPPSPPRALVLGNNALQDYHMQLLSLEFQNRMMVLARLEVEARWIKREVEACIRGEWL